MYWAVVGYTGLARPGPKVARFVLLCFKEEPAKNSTERRLHAGLSLFAGWVGKEPKIRRLRVLKAESFTTKRVGRSFILSYKGKVTGKSNYDPGIDSTWLCFEVKAKKNRNKVASIVKTFYTLLEKEKYAEEIVQCSTPLLDEQVE